MADTRMNGGVRRRLARVLLCGVPPWARDAARGDLDEEHARMAARHGRIAGALWYVREALLLSVRYAPEWRRGAPGLPRSENDRHGAAAFVRHLSGDLRLALRQVRLDPGFWCAATLILGVAIGFNATIFSLVNAVLFKPLARTDPDRVVRVYARTGERAPSASFSYLDFRSLRDATPLTQVSAVHLATLVMTDGGASDQLLGEIASASYFDLLGVPMLAGRPILASDDARGASPVALISEHYWRNRLGASPGVIGRPVRIGGRPFTVTGIVSARFGGSFIGGGVDLWLPLESALPLLGPTAASDGRTRPLQMLGRLSVGLTREQADAALAPFEDDIARNRDVREPVRLELVPGTLLHGNARRTAAVFLSILTALVGLVLLIAASNVANLLLARTLGRRREMAIRLALGAGRWRIAQQLAAESLVLAGGGFALALALAWGIGRAFRSVAVLPGFDLRLDLAPDARVFVVTALVALTAGLVATLMPAVSAGRGDLVPFLREGGASLGSRRTARLRGTLVVAQLAIAVMVCVAAALLAKSGRAASAVDLGFDRGGIFATDIDLDVLGYTRPKAEAFYRALLARTSALPGVERAALASRAPLDSSTPGLRVLREGEHDMPMARGGADLESTFYVVSPDYFAVVGIPLTAGRPLRETDRPESPQVAVVNEFFVQALWPGLQVPQAIGRRVRVAPGGTGAGPRGEFEIVGVARNAKYRTVGEPAQPHLYLPFAQHHAGSMALLVRGRTHPLPMQEVQAAMASLDPAVQGFFTRSLQEHTRVALLPAVFASRVSAAVGIVSAVLGAIGLHALIACVVAERRREFGLRMALGASTGQVSAAVIRQALMLSAAGCIAGAVFALLTAGLLGSLLYGVSPADPAVYASVIIAAMTIAVISTWLPARRAARTAPTIAMRV